MYFQSLLSLTCFSCLVFFFGFLSSLLSAFIADNCLALLLSNYSFREHKSSSQQYRSHSQWCRTNRATRGVCPITCCKWSTQEVRRSNVFMVGYGSDRTKTSAGCACNHWLRRGASVLVLVHYLYNGLKYEIITTVCLLMSLQTLPRDCTFREL